MSLNGVRGASGNQNVKIWSSAIGSSSALMPGTSSSALTSEAKTSAPSRERVVERPHAHAVARQHQALAARVPDREGEVAVEVSTQSGPLLLVEVEDDLGVGVGLESDGRAAISSRAQLDVVEDLAVEGDPDGAVLVAIGCWPAARSMMLSRAWARPTSPST